MKLSLVAKALIAAASAHLCAFAQHVMTVAVFDCAATPHSVLAPAVDAARRTFLHAGISSQWIICQGETCERQLPSSSYMELFVVPRLQTPLADHLFDHPAGFAMREGFRHPRAYAICDTARMVADRTMRPLDVVLAVIMIHEVGHLLGLSHQPRGAMRATLETDDLDGSSRGRAFSSQEVRKLRAALY